MRKLALIILAVFTVIGLSAGSAMSAVPTISTLSVTQNGFNKIMNTLSSCGTQTTSNDYKAPIAPAYVNAAVAVDSFAGSVRDSGNWVTANGLPMVNFTKHITRTYFYPDGSFAITVAGIGHTWDAYVPGLFGRSCSEWTKVQAKDF